MKAKKSDAATIFKAHHIKSTKQRKMVYDYLERSEHPVTAEVIYRELREQDSLEDTMNLSTVYRILDVFVRSQLVVKKVYGQYQCSTYEMRSNEHKHHLVCVKCHKITVLNGCPLKGYDEMVRNETQYRILEHRLELFGICPECQKSDCY